MLQGLGGPKGSGFTWVAAKAAIASGMVGGIISGGTNGNFGSGFLAAGVSTLSTPLAGSLAGGDKLIGTLINATVGGASSVLGGAKFGNGAVTGAFGYLASACTSGCNGDGEPKYYLVNLEMNGGPDLSPADMQDMLSRDMKLLGAEHLTPDASVTLDPRYVYLDEEGKPQDAGSLSKAMVYSLNGYRVPRAVTIPGGWFSQDRVVVYASAFYSATIPENKIGRLSGLEFLNFVLLHEFGHVSITQRGGGCGSNEDCADSYALKNYLKTYPH